ncbi:MAG: aldo/keto reductase [Actinobacteria bacterium]|nr:aldo/keto reductase [Actinomycetota bacterium]
MNVMPTRRLGRTEHLSSVAILGTAAYGRSTPDEVGPSFHAAIESGINHIDIAPGYGNAEVLVGEFLPAVRDRVFLGEKSGATSGSHLRRHLERTLERLGTDHVDLYQAHGVISIDDLDSRDEAFEAILQARDEGLTRFVGITGHDFGTPAAQLEAVKRYDLDTVMLPVYPGALAHPQYATDLAALLDEAARRDLGVQAIKVGAHQPWGDRTPTHACWYEPFTEADLLARGVRFTLSTPGVHVFATTGDMRLIPTLVEAAKAYTPMTPAERDALLTEAAEWPTIFPLTEHAKG